MFEWLPSHPWAIDALNAHMATRRANQPSWVEVFPVRKFVNQKDFPPERALFVDIGGNIGHKAIEFRTAYPDIPGRVIVQDLPFVVRDAMTAIGVEAMAYDFNTPQPIKGSMPLQDWCSNY
jgi:demethylsterigmatocystin 6-O-methyltransferase